MINIGEPEYDELVRQSTKGSKDALDKLFAIGEGHLVSNNPVNAAKAFKDSAISYRIAVLRNEAQLEATQNEVDNLIEDIQILKEWISIFPNGHVDLPKFVTGLNNETIEAAMYGNLGRPSDPAIIRIYSFLNFHLAKCNKEFASINGNRPKFISGMLFSYFGLDITGRFYSDFSTTDALNSIDVRVGLDLLAYKIEAMFLIQGKQVPWEKTNE